MEHPRVQNSSLSQSLWGLTLILCLGATACDEDIGWPSAPPASQDRPCEGGAPGDKGPGIPGLQDPEQPAQTQPQDPKAQHPDATQPAPGSQDPQSPGTQTPKGPDASSPQPDSTLPDEDSGAPQDNAPSDPIGTAIWEFLPDPKGSDGLADSPETVDLIVTGDKEQEGTVTFELQAQGWSPLTHESFPDHPTLRMRTGSLIRIERYKNQAQLDLAKAQFPDQVLDPKTGEIAVQILRMTGAGLRNKGGWLALRSGPEAALHGVIYGDITKEKIDSQVLADWHGPFATKAPSGQALCKIPERPKGSQTDAAWWTACEPSIWGRPSK